MDSPSKFKISRRRLLQLAGGALASCATAAGYAFYVEPDLLTINEREIYVPDLPAGMDGMRVLQLTDFHFHQDYDQELLEKVVRKCADIDPDIVCYTGDYITDGMESFDFLMEHLNKVSAKHGIYACLGNHDLWHGDVAKMKASFKRSGIDVLQNDCTKLSIAGESLDIVGTDSVWGGTVDLERSFRGVKRKSPAIALVHEPDFFDQVGEYKESFVQLSGHTHGGQCRVPLVNYAPVTVKYGKKYINGYFKHDEKKQLYVSSGVGTVDLRVRFACLPELMLLTLKSI